MIAFPHYIAHFSALVGGGHNGARFLNDSNLDWGQDWNRLARKAVARGWQPMAYVYIGAGDPAAEMPAAVDAFNLRSLPSGGYVAVSSFAEAVGVPYLRAFGYREAAARLAALLEVTRGKGKAVGGIGGTITVYSLPDATGPAPSLETGPRARQHRSRGLGAFFRPSELAWREPRRSGSESPSARPCPPVAHVPRRELRVLHAPNHVLEIADQTRVVDQLRGAPLAVIQLLRDLAQRVRHHGEVVEEAPGVLLVVHQARQRPFTVGELLCRRRGCGRGLSHSFERPLQALPAPGVPEQSRHHRVVPGQVLRQRLDHLAPRVGHAGKIIDKVRLEPEGRR